MVYDGFESAKEAEREPGADPAETYHEFDMGLVAAHQNEIARLRTQRDNLLAALKWTHGSIHPMRDDGSPSCTHCWIRDAIEAVS